MTDQPAKTDPTRLTPAQAAEMLSREGQCTITPAMIEADIRAGCPVNEDGTINVIVYGAWLLKQGE